MISLTEKLIPLKAVADIVPGNVRGKKIAHSTVWRWAARGVDGVVLETLNAPGGRVTSREAVQRFLTALTSRRSGRRPVAVRARRTGAATARRRLAADGVWGITERSDG